MECRLCPRACGVNRGAGRSGICGVSGEGILVSRAALHFWEEPCISGKEGSGTVFFTGCPLRCVYCQNYTISKGEQGKRISVERLSEIFLELQVKGANNINLVTPTHYSDQILPAIRLARKKGLTIPMVYNCSGYEKEETLRMLDGWIDIYLTDFKYMDSEMAKKYSKAPDYPEVAKKALAEMVRQVPQPSFDERGMMTKGVIVRHLLLPGHVKNGKVIVSYLQETYQNKLFISMMNQYTPLPQVTEQYPELARKVTKREYERLIDHALAVGVEQAFIQEGDVAMESFIPAFDGEGV